MSVAIRTPGSATDDDPSSGDGERDAPPASGPPTSGTTSAIKVPIAPRSCPSLLPGGGTTPQERKVAEDAPTLPPEDSGCASADLGAALPIIDPSTYRVTGEVAQGGIGRILRARDVALDRPVALKELRGSTNPIAAERFIREALLTARLQHPAIVPLYEAGRWPSGEPFYAMKYVSGRSFDEVIAERRSLAQRLGLLPHVLAVAEAIAYAHSERIIHRDLKPSNILVGPFGETVVIDWGLAKDLGADARDTSDPLGGLRAIEDLAARGELEVDASLPTPSSRRSVEALTMHGSIMGTPAYMPPEQALGRRVDERADVYALGAILYHLLAGASPYEGDTGVEILRKVIAGKPAPLARRTYSIPQDLLTIVNKAMARDAADRYPSAQELADDLRRFQTGQIVAAHKYSTMELFGRFARRYRAALAVATGALVLLGITVGLSFRDNVEQRYRAQAGEAEALVAKREAVARADDLTLMQARAAVERDPNEAVDWLRTLSPSFDRWAEARLIAADAHARGLAAVLRGHTAHINDVSFSPDGKLLATASDDRTVMLWDLSTGKGSALYGHADEAWDVVFSPSGKRLATCGKDNTVRVWDVERRVPLQIFRGHTNSVYFARFIGEDELLSAAIDDTVRRLDIRTGEERVILANGYVASRQSLGAERLLLAKRKGEHLLYDIERGDIRRVGAEFGDESFGASFFPDGESVAVRARDGSVQRWDLRTGKVSLLGAPLVNDTGTLTRTHSVVFFVSPDGKYVAGAGEGPDIRVWDVATGAARVFSGHQGLTNCIAFSPDGAWLASGSYDHTARLWDLKTGDSRILRGFDDVVSRVTFSPDGKTLAAASSDATILLFPVTTSASRVSPDRGAPFLTAAFSPDGHWLAIGGADGDIRLSDRAMDTRILLQGHLGPVRQVMFSPDGDLIASFSDDQSVRVWDLSGHEIWSMRVPLPRLESGFSKYVIAFSPDGRLLAAPTEGSAVQILDTDSGALRQLQGHTQTVRTLAFSPDGASLASGGDDRTVRLWDLASGASRTNAGHEDTITALAFSPDGRTLASGSMDHTLWLWSTTSSERRRVDASGFGIFQIVFLADGNSALTLGFGETGVRIWDTKTGAARGLLRGHTEVVTRFALSGDAQRLVTSCVDGTVRLWDLQTRKSRVLQGHVARVTDAIFSPDGAVVASTSEDRSVRLWPDDLPHDKHALRQWILERTRDSGPSYHGGAAPSPP
jgi:eukaryotic-like serine/threonine-protein kinase